MTRSIMNLAAGCLMMAGLSALGGCNGARDTAVKMGETSNHLGFIHKTLNNEGRTRQYVVFLPLNYTPNHKWPAIMFLHGIGEAGHDMEGPMRVGIAPFVADKAANFPFIVIIPQSTGGWDANSDSAKDAIAALVQAEHDYAIDPDRVSLTGLSTGGYGTFAIGAKFNYMFAALAPMCPSGADTSDGETLAKMPLWAFENAMDPFVTPFSMAMSLGSISSAGGHFKHSVFANVGHDCWEKAYGDGEVFTWMLQQRRHNGGATHAAVSTPVEHSVVHSVTPVRPAVRSSASVVPAHPVAAQTSSNGGASMPETPY